MNAGIPSHCVLGRLQGLPVGSLGVSGQRHHRGLLLADEPQQLHDIPYLMAYMLNKSRKYNRAASYPALWQVRKDPPEINANHTTRQRQAHSRDSQAPSVVPKATRGLRKGVSETVRTKSSALELCAHQPIVIGKESSTCNSFLLTFAEDGKVYSHFI